ncbi:MAG: TRAP transporter substrate-binding protein, partial [Bacteroidia bacterium]|nr:TRAP transporter substrate-binding protein [Bacteroidia bacterium]
MKLSRRALTCTAAAAALACLAPAAFAAKFNLKLGHAVNTTDGQHAAAVKMAELVKERTKGDVEITIFPANQLGNDA